MLVKSVRRYRRKIKINCLPSKYEITRKSEEHLGDKTRWRKQYIFLCKRRIPIMFSSFTCLTLLESFLRWLPSWHRKNYPQNLRSAFFEIIWHLWQQLELGSSVGIVTGYGLDGPGIESRWGDEIFRTRPDRPWDPSSLVYNGYRVFPGGKAAGAWPWPPTPF